MDDPLTPFLASIRAEAKQAVRTLVGAPEGYEIDWRRDSAGVVSTLRSPRGRPLRLAIRWDAPGTWQIGGHALTFFRDTDGCDPLRDPDHLALLAKLAGAFANGEAPRRSAAMARAEALLRGTLADDERLEDRFYRSVEKTTQGVTGMLRLGFGCNQNCGFCWQGRDWPAPPKEYYWTWLEEIAAMGCRMLTLTGGEPTLSPELPGLIEHATRVHGMEVHLQTNAIRMRRAGYTASLVEAGLRSVLVSLHSADSEVSDFMTRAPGTHRGTVGGIRELQRAGVNVILNCVVDRDNYTDLGAHARLVVDEMVRPFPENPIRVVNYSQPSDYHDFDRFRRNMVAIDDVGPHLIEAATVLREAGVVVAAIGTCGFPACTFEAAPDLVEWHARTDLEEIHLSARHREASACAGCAASEYCTGVREAYVELHGERGLVPFALLPIAARIGTGGGTAQEWSPQQRSAQDAGAHQDPRHAAVTRAEPAASRDPLRV